MKHEGKAEIFILFFYFTLLLTDSEVKIVTSSNKYNLIILP